MNQSLKVVLEAEVKGLERKLNSAKKKLKDFEGGVEHTDKQLGKFSKTTRGNATPALMSFSQVVQDSPYGIRGVANNIEQLVAQMGYLSQSSKQAGITMKQALIAGLTGPAGIMIAVSVVTAGLTALETSGFKAADAIKFLSGKSTEAAQAQRKLAESYRESEGKIRAELSVLNALLLVAKDENVSREERSRAIDAVNDKFPELHENLRLETVNSEKATEAVNKLTESLLRQAKIEGVQGLIAEKYAKLSEYATQSAEDSADFLDILAAIGSGTTTGGVLSLSDALKTFGAKTATKETQKLNDEIESLDKFLQGLIGEDIKVGGVFTETDEIKTKNGKRPKVKAVLELETSAVNPMDSESMQFGKAINDQITALEKIQRSLPAASQEYQVLAERIQFLKSVMEPMSETATKNLEAFKAMFNGLDERSKSLDQLALKAQLFTQMFQLMGNHLVDALTGGEDAFKNFVKSFLKSASKMLLGLVAQAIGNSILGATQAATAAGPAAPFVLPGLIAGSTGVVQGAFGSLPSFNDGGIVGGGMVTGDKVLARLNSGEMVLNQSQQSGLFRALNNSSLGGSEPLEIVGQTVISGQDIIVSYKRAESRNNRIG